MEILAKGRFLELVQRNGWEFVHRTRGSTPVGIIAVNDKRELILIEQYRVPLQRNVLEIPAGLVGDEHQAESWQEAAGRELVEETGYGAEGFELLSTGPTSAGLTDEQIMLVWARGVAWRCKAVGDGHEQIKVHCMPLHKIERFVDEYAAQGTVDPKVYAALYWVKRFTKD